MARRTLREIAYGYDNRDEFWLPLTAHMMLFIAEIAAILAIIWVAIWCWEQHWLLGLIATICPIIGLYHAVTKEPTR